MKTISRTIKHDEVLGLEAFCLQGYREFPAVSYSRRQEAR